MGKDIKKFRVLYDEQCEICQAGVTWLRLLDRRGIVQNEPMSPERLASLDSRLDAEACARELHVLGPSGELWVGGGSHCSEGVERLAYTRTSWGNIFRNSKSSLDNCARIISGIRGSRPRY